MEFHEISLSDLVAANQNLSKTVTQFQVQYWGNEKGRTFGKIGNKVV